MASKTNRKLSVRSKAFKMEGVPQMIKMVRTITDTLTGEAKSAFEESIRDAMLKPAEAMAQQARQIAGTFSVTGALRDSIGAAKLAKSMGAFIFTEGVKYAHMVEYGTSKMKAHPFFRPGINSTRNQAAAMMAADFKNVIEDITQAEAWHEGDGSPT